MNYYYDCEFLEGTQTKRILGVPYGKTPPTIDLISIGIVAEDGRELYLISKEFNLKEAWNRYDWYSTTTNKSSTSEQDKDFKVYWIRENVLKPVFIELLIKHLECGNLNNLEGIFEQEKTSVESKFTYPLFKYLLKKYGKTREEIKQGIFDFVNPNLMFSVTAYNNSELKPGGKLDNFFNTHDVTSDGKYYYAQPKFYGYYSAYDHVALCWLFGKMIDLPKGFPMYTIDLKQELESSETQLSNGDWVVGNDLKTLPNYPQNTNKHSAIFDARWNRDLHNFLKQL